MLSETRGVLTQGALRLWLRLRFTADAATTRCDLALAGALRGARGGCDRFGHSFAWERFGRPGNAESLRVGETLWHRCQWCRDVWSYEPGEDPQPAIDCPRCGASLPGCFKGCTRCGADLSEGEARP